MKIISLGEILWDVFSDAEYLGGAAFNFAAQVRRLGHEVYFVSAVGDDERGGGALARMRELDLPTTFVPRLRDHSTGIVTVKLDAAGQPDFTLHRPAAYDFASLSPEELASISSPPPDWIYFGSLHQIGAQARDLLDNLIAANPRAHRFFDINLRKDSYDAPLITRLLDRATVVKMNDAEVEVLTQMLGEPGRSLEDFSRHLAKAHGFEAVCVTRGAAGCALLIGNDYVEVPGYVVQVADTVGAGDAFAAGFLHGLNLIPSGWTPVQIGDFANRVGALISSRPGGTPAWSVEEALALKSAPAVE